MTAETAAKPLVLIDGSSYLYRAFHALPPLVNSHREPTGAILGVANMLKKMLADYAPEQIVVVFDSKEKTFRDDLYPEYKAHRAVMPDELRVQIQPLYDLIAAMGLPLLIIPGVEADDVIGTLAQMASRKNQSVVISTGDKDMAQLVNAHISLINTMNNQYLDETGVYNKFGVKPTQIIDYLMLVGDTSDNVPGIAGVGPKTAAKWLNQYGSLDNIIAHQMEIPGRVGEQLRTSIQQFDLTRKLIEIKCDVELSHIIENPEFLKPKKTDTEKLILLLKQFEFKRWLEEFSVSSPPIEKNKSRCEYQCIIEINQLEDLLKQCEEKKLFAFDTETTSLNIIDARLVGMSFAVNEKAYYIPLAHDYLGAPLQLDISLVLRYVKPLLENPEYQKIAHNAKYDINILRNHQIELQGVEFDTMLESYVLDSTATRHDMDSLALKYLGRKTITFEDIAGKGQKQLSFNQISIDKACEYAAEDAEITAELHNTFWPKLSREPDLLNAYRNIELPLSFVLADMERHGVLIDAEKLKKQSEELGARIAELEKQAWQEAGEQFNLASPKQLQEIFYTRQGLPVFERTPSGQPSTAENVLQELALLYPLPKLILEHRTLSKLKSTYTDKLPEQIHPATGRVHTSYQQAVTSTGRLSSSNPNLQNIPIRTEEGRRIRQAFIAPNGYKILAADYSQIELRLMAHLSQDKNLLDAFAQGLDIHSATAAEIFNVNLQDVNVEQRRRAKAINFGLIYGMSAFGLAKQIGEDRKIAQEYMDIYFARYPGVKNYMTTTCQSAHHDGFVSTLFGRKLFLPEINARNKLRQKGAERAAINAPLQGSAADLIKIAMINIQEWLKKNQLPVAMIMQVHDELVFEVSENYLEEAKQHIKNLMENAAIISVPLIVSIGTGNNWDEAH